MPLPVSSSKPYAIITHVHSFVALGVTAFISRRDEHVQYYLLCDISPAIQHATTSDNIETSSPTLDKYVDNNSL
jgi:hypothetical protein